MQPSEAPTTRRPTAGRMAIGHPVDVATGNLFQEEEDHVIPGRVPLVLGRRYSGNLLDRPPGIFGPGWASSFEIRLKRDLDGFTFFGEDGETEIVFDDPEGALEAGAVLRNLSTFHDLRRDGRELLVTRWNPESGEVVRFRFLPGPDEAWWPLRSRESVSGEGIDLRFDAQGRPLVARQRREGRGYRLIYQGARLIEVKRVVGAHERTVMRYGYDRQGRLASATDALGHQSRYEYDERGRLIRDVTPGGMVYHFRYDAAGRCYENTGLDGFARYTLRVDEAAHVTRVTDPLDHETLYEWNQNRQITREISPLGRITASIYDDDGRLVEKIAPGGAATRYGYDERGDRVQVVAPGGAETRLEFDADHQLVAVVDPAGHRWSREFDARRRPVRVSDPGGASYRLEHDPAGDLAAIVDPLGHVRRFQYNERGDLVAATDWKGHLTRYEYDLEGNLLAVIDPLGRRTEARRDELGRVRELVLPDGATRRYGWNVFDELTELVDERGAVTRNRYSPCGNLVETVRPDGAKVTLEWSLVPGQLLSVNNARGEQYHFVWDSDGKLVRERDFAGRESRYTYGPDGRLAQQIDPAGRRTRIEHDLEGRPLRLTFDDGSATRFAYDPRGLLTKADNGHCLIERRYDEAGRLVLERQGDHVLEHTYDAVGNRLLRRSSLGHETAFRWDPNGQLERLELPGAPAIEFAYNPLQQELARAFGGGPALEREYDLRGRLSAQWFSRGDGRKPGQVAVGGRTMLRRYDYDPAGNLTRVLEPHGGTSQYRYDAVGRIVEAALSTGREERFTYDLNDNLLWRGRKGGVEGGTGSVAPPGAGAWETGPGGETEACRYGAGDLLVQRGETRYEYDRLGQLVRKLEPHGETRFLWNLHQQLERVVLPDGREWRYRYDALGRRVEKQGPDRRVEFVWDGDVILHERRVGEDEVAVVHWEFEPEGFAPLARGEGERTAFCATDQIGLPRELIDEAGRVVWRARFTTWGELDAQDVAEVDCPVRFQGQWHDEETGLHYNRFRYYDPEVGRYVSQDPIGLLGGINVFTYGLNSNAWVDPRGLSGLPLVAGDAGRFGDLDRRAITGDNLTPHHMPQAAAGYTDYEEGGALVLTHQEHLQTRTYGGKGRKVRREEAGLSFREALARDIRDIRALFGKKYDEGIRQLLKYYEEKFPELMKKRNNGDCNNA